jgi:hypothetical protein
VQLRFVLLTVGIAVGLFLGMLLSLELGRRLGIRQIAKRGQAAQVGVGVVDSAVYAVLALLIGFSFSGAASRFDARRELIVREGNAISSAWQYLDMLPPDSRSALRDELRHFVDELIALYGNPQSTARDLRDRDQIVAVQNGIWTHAVAACLDPRGERARMLLLPALTQMFDSVEEERLARRMHPPAIVFVMLVLTALASSLFAGYSMASGATRNWIYIIGITATISIATYVIVELEFPRIGIVRVNAFDKALVELRQTMR